ncbi:putative caffeate O-methyltransferase [Helianthus annuus]|uniref:Caffeate O-methyltransferase n=1 Tax=Helianthus annuus TaxID=4232 RepID=A0A251S5G3_HELAN|nr:caffeic acid 3-O-methyltransferase [Helianthus annuus]KAF5762938.1 putative caffeate O-methyltransferase [Helianthus annuus]KAJ0449922.1 putative caffeate O-methyltransferase [Helianthus annuus]KAJ0471648.1 putative caffeate O-methyltransferase [Helianthus annuus]KAJ0647288.1 putative caffeate O-methyltransferase [Helianthus annuus]KAJ0651172.1 putative caffeate O-methyltransferase [Helianthus annuus]
MGSNEEHYVYAMQLVSSSTLTMVLMNVIKLKVLEAIAEAGPDARLTAHEIVSRLKISNQDAPDMVDRMLRLLASYSIVTCTKGVHESRPVRVYGLTPVARYFIPDEDGASLGTLLELGQDKAVADDWIKLKDSVIEGGVPFERNNGATTFEFGALDARFDNVFNNAMLNHTTIVMKRILECYDGFDGLKRVVDVGGGLGATINMIVSKHPTIKGINFDLPHVTRHAPLYPGVEHVGGDMFQKVPQGDAVFMKWILHDWSDDDCVKLLKNCYKALPVDGKVIIVEAILPFVPDTSSSVKVSTQLDVVMMTHYHGGKERTEDEFLALATGAGFTGIRKKCFACNFWVMEFYK